MYDENGKQTQLRKYINHILYKIATKELGESYLSGVNSEIAYARDKLQPKPEKKKKEPKQPTQDEIIKKQLEYIEKHQKKEEEKLNADLFYTEEQERQIHENYKYCMLKVIGMNKKEIRRKSRFMLPPPNI